MAEEPVTGRRARQKLDTRRRVRDAAWELFTAHGYEQTTTKAVARRAGVASGTVFVHARDKDDLLMLVMHDRLQSIVDAQFATLPKDGPLLDQLLHIFRGLYRMYGEHPNVSAAFIRASPGASGPNGQRLTAATFGFLVRLSEVVRHAQLRGEVASDIEPMLAAQNLFALYFAGLLAWMSGFFSIQQALAQVLVPSLKLQIRGLRA